MTALITLFCLTFLLAVMEHIAAKQLKVLADDVEDLEWDIYRRERWGNHKKCDYWM